MPYYETTGAKLYFEETGSGDPLLLIPGWGGSIVEMTPLLKKLEPHYRVIAVDPPGSGKSGPQPRTYTATYYRDDVHSLVALINHLDAGPAHIVGFSDGGEYALLIAALHPDLARSLVTWGAAGSLGTNPEFAGLMSSLIDAPIPPMEGFAEYMKSSYGEQGARIMTQSAGQAFRQIIDGGGDLSRAIAHQITCPATLITGEHDFLATPALTRDMAQAIPRGEFIEARGASHGIHHEQPEWLFDTVVARLAVA